MHSHLSKSWAACWLAAVCLYLGLGSSVLAAIYTPKVLSGHVPAVIAQEHLAASGLLADTNQLNLALGLPLRHPAELSLFLSEISNPGSTNYHHYLTPEQFTAQYGPTPEDYQRVINFAETNGFKVMAQHGNRLVLDVQGSPTVIDRAFHLTLRTYHHPTENREFFAPDREPTVDASLPIVDISGLNNYSRPHPLNVLKKNSDSTRAVPRSGSGPFGYYFGSDFRNAYVPGTALTGSGQMVGLFQFDGYYPTDITNFTAHAGLTNIPLTTVLLDQFDGTPVSSDGSREVSLDIEMAMSMAPALSGIVVFEAGEGGNAVDILSSMVASNQISQFSCSWGWNGIPNSTLDTLFLDIQVFQDTQE